VKSTCIIDQKATGASDDANARFFAVRLVYRVYYKSFQINVHVHTILDLLDDVSIDREESASSSLAETFIEVRPLIVVRMFTRN
jgi:hypothetical protein